MLIVCAALTIPFWFELRHAPFAHQAQLLAMLLPSLVAFVFPFAIAFIVDIVRPRAEASPAQRIGMARIALAATLFAFLFGGWVVPTFNQMVRIQTRGYDLPADTRGVRELSTWELIVDPSLAPEREPFTGNADRATRVRAEIQNRLYIVLLPILLVFQRWQSLGLPRNGALPLPAGAATLLTFVGVITVYFGTWRIEKALGLPAGASSWLAITALGGWGLLTARRRRILEQATGGAARLVSAFQNSRMP